MTDGRFDTISDSSSQFNDTSLNAESRVIGQLEDPSSRKYLEEDETDQGLVRNPCFRPPNKSICGQYCKRMPAWTQKIIITNCLKEYLIERTPSLTTI